MDLAATPVQNPDVLSRKVSNGEMVLVNADTGASLALTNRTAVAVWELVDGHRNLHDIIDGLKDRFRDVPKNVAGDVLALIELLVRDGFIGFEFNPEI